MRAEQRHVRRYETLATARLAGLVALCGALAACGGVKIKPDPQLPKPLMQPLPATVGLVLPRELRTYEHKETRWGTDWQISLGPGHVHLMHDIFQDSFSSVQEFNDLSAAVGANVQALFEPRIDQYSFVTARDTPGGRYCAVTIRYRFDLFTPKGERLDTLTLIGYGSALANSMTSGGPLEHATLAAMRDAAAKFLVQFPDQPMAQQLANHEVLSVQQASAESMQIEAVPIEESEEAVVRRAAPAPASPAAPPPATPAAPPATPTATTPKSPSA